MLKLGFQKTIFQCNHNNNFCTTCTAKETNLLYCSHCYLYRAFTTDCSDGFHNSIC